MPVHQAVFPLLLIPLLLAVGLAIAPGLTLRILGWFIALNLLLVACVIAGSRAQTPDSPVSGVDERARSAWTAQGCS